MCAIRIAQNGNEVTMEIHGTGGDCENNVVVKAESDLARAYATCQSQLTLFHTHGSSGVTPQSAENVLLLVLGYTRMAFRVLIDHQQESNAPYGTDRTEHVKNRRPTAIETIFG